MLGALAAACGLKLGVVSTSDSLDSTPTDLHLMRAEGAAVKEMEAAAVAWVCEQLRVPFAAIKSITDIVDGPHATRAEFEANLGTASTLLQLKVRDVLLRVAGARRALAGLLFLRQQGIYCSGAVASALSCKLAGHSYREASAKAS